MKLGIEINLAYALAEPTDVLLQLEAADLGDQRVTKTQIATSKVEHFSRVMAEDDVGERIWLRADEIFSCTYLAEVEIDRRVRDIRAMNEVSPHLLPGDVVRYILPSRYCPSDEFQSFVAAEFGHLEGGARIAAMRDWIETAFTYAPGSSSAQTTALDSFVQRQGICRDFAHVLITLARASSIPARFVSAYAPDVTPPDFHAVAEVYLDNAWHLIDPTGMAAADTIARIGVGPDAASVAFLTAFGRVDFVSQSVVVSRLD
ncbi:MAG: transglutaminase family protein [Pseudomonadota bacterium]